MKEREDEDKLRALLARELKPVSAPEQLWLRVEAALNNPRPELIHAPRVRLVLALAAGIAVFTLAVSYYYGSSYSGQARRQPELALDLQPYLAPVQLASISASAPAISQPPAHFASVDSARAHALIAGYKVAAERVTWIHGEPVKQVILTMGENAVALFIASSKVRLDMGADPWVEDHMAGMACKRLNCPRVRSFEFPCSAETCLIICKACSQDSMTALMTEVVERSPELR
jgi:hypothetical protein